MEEDSESSADEDMESFCGDSDCDNNDSDMEDDSSDYESDSNDNREGSDGYDGTKGVSDDSLKREANYECKGLSQEVLHVSVPCKDSLANF